MDLIFGGARLYYQVFSGMNIADRYSDLPGQPAWFDVAIFTEGRISSQLCNICANLWSNKKTYINNIETAAGNRKTFGCMNTNHLYCMQK